MRQEYRTCLGTLREQALLPEHCCAAFVAGSVTRGWGNPTSDLDLYVVTKEPWRRDDTALEPVALQPGTVPVVSTYAGGQRWDLTYWLDDQVEQMMAKLSWQRFNSGRPPGALSVHELELLERLPHAVPLAGDGWLDRYRARLHESALRAILVSRDLSRADHYIEDTVGLLAVGDLDSAVLAARLAFGSTVDALLASHGELGQNPKWRARRFREVDQSVLAFADYWSVETMHGYSPAATREWVDDVVRRCRRIAMEVSI